MNVTSEDEKVERYVMGLARGLYEPFFHYDFDHKKGAEIFDYHGFYLGVHKISVDVKYLYSDPLEYSTNILSLDKWDEALKNGHLRDHYMIYYYNSLMRIYDLGRCHPSFGKVKIWHKREKAHREDEVVFLPLSDAIFEYNL